MKIEFTKEVVESLIELFGKDKAIDELVNSCRVMIEESIKDLDKEKQ